MKNISIILAVAVGCNFGYAFAGKKKKVTIRPHSNQSVCALEASAVSCWYDYVSSTCYARWNYHCKTGTIQTPCQGSVRAYIFEQSATGNLTFVDSICADYSFTCGETGTLTNSIWGIPQEYGMSSTYVVKWEIYGFLCASAGPALDNQSTDPFMWQMPPRG